MAEGSHVAIYIIYPGIGESKRLPIHRRPNTFEELMEQVYAEAEKLVVVEGTDTASSEEGPVFDDKVRTRLPCHWLLLLAPPALNVCTDDRPQDERLCKGGCGEVRRGAAMGPQRDPRISRVSRRCLGCPLQHMANPIPHRQCNPNPMQM